MIRISAVMAAEAGAPRGRDEREALHQRRVQRHPRDPVGQAEVVDQRPRRDRVADAAHDQVERGRG